MIELLPIIYLAQQREHLNLAPAATLNCCVPEFWRSYSENPDVNSPGVHPEHCGCCADVMHVIEEAEASGEKFEYIRLGG